jgi:outer membrane protein assembly factor BamE
MRLTVTLLGLAASLALSGCGVIYKVNVQQGNLLEQEMIDGLRPGMSKRQVALVMGTPAINSPFHQNRWDYISTFAEDGGDMEVKRFTLYFENDVLARMEGDYQPSEAGSGSAEDMTPSLDEAIRDASDGEEPESANPTKATEAAATSEGVEDGGQ